MRPEKNPLVRRLREVEQSRDELRAEIKRLERALKKPERLMDNPHLLPSTRVAPRIRTTTVPATATPEQAAPAQAEQPADSLAAGNRRASVAGNETFAHLFSSTRFLGAPALRHERRVQRNRAIFWVIVAIFFGSIVYHFAFR